MQYVTEAVKALIGAETDLIEAPHPVEPSEVRRFHHATMDGARRYWDTDWTAGSRYGSLVAPPAFPMHAFRRGAADPDPLDAIGDPDFDGVSRSFRGLPAIQVPLPRLLNGGYVYEFYRYARVGERIFRKSRYEDIYEREGKSGPMVFVIIEDGYQNEAGEGLFKATSTIILR